MIGAQAVRNRRTILANEIRSLILQQQARNNGDDNDETLQVTSMACGPARELQDVFLDANANGIFPNMNCHLIDLDDEALNVAKGWMEDIPNFPHDRVTLNQKNLLRLAVGKESLNLPPQDFIYSAGLIDYFKDNTIIRLLNYAYDNLKVGGKVLFGNFHVDNPTRGLMDSALEWVLIHRDEEQMANVFRRSKFGTSCDIMFDETGVQMMAVCVKQESGSV